MKRGFTLIELMVVVAMAAVVIVCVIWFAAGRTDDAEAQRALSDQGFSNITITDHGYGFTTFHGCGDGDGSWYSATADNSAGKRVNMTVCCGGPLQFKGCTLRSK